MFEKISIHTVETQQKLQVYHEEHNRYPSGSLRINPVLHCTEICTVSMHGLYPAAFSLQRHDAQGVAFCHYIANSNYVTREKLSFVSVCERESVCIC